MGFCLFRNFAFFGVKGVVWSDERCKGYRSEVERIGGTFHAFETGKDSDALHALASLYAFARDMEPLMDGTSRAEYPSYCMAVFRLLTEKPELRAAYASALEKQFDMLAKDIYRVNAYAELKKLIPALESGILPETGTEPVSETEGVLTAVNGRGDCAYA